MHILENREYTGCLVNFKTEKLSYKVKHSVENSPEKQVIFENHHEPCLLYTSNNHSGNIHVHIVINSLRIYEVPLLPYMDLSLIHI